MRPLELLSILCCCGYILWRLFGSDVLPSPYQALPFLAAAAVLVHLWREGYRWQMVPVYLVVVLLLALSFYPYLKPTRARYTVLAALSAVCLLGSSALAGGVLFPVFEFEPLTGPLPVGTASFHLVDRSRHDPYAPDPTACRELMIQIWYPAQPGGSRRLARYQDPSSTDWSTSYLSLVRTRSLVKPPVSQKHAPYPVLLFSSFDKGNRFHATYLTEELASRGYIVVGIDHPYDSALVVYPDGRRAVGRPDTFLNFSSDEALRKSRASVESDLQVRVADVEFVLDELTRWNGANSHSMFSGSLDLNEIGMIGHSFGGAVCAEVCRTDPRVRAGINMDGWMFGEAQTLGVPKPFFFMTDDTPRPEPGDWKTKTSEKNRFLRQVDSGFEDIDRSLAMFGGYTLTVPGLAHMNYADLALFSGIPSWSGTGPINTRRAHKIINAYALAFFNKALLGHVESLLCSKSSTFPEVQFKSVNSTRPLRSCVPAN